MPTLQAMQSKHSLPFRGKWLTFAGNSTQWCQNEWMQEISCIVCFMENNISAAFFFDFALALLPVFFLRKCLPLGAVPAWTGNQFVKDGQNLTLWEVGVP